jgi:hypothetical protein
LASRAPVPERRRPSSGGRSQSSARCLRYERTFLRRRDATTAARVGACTSRSFPARRPRCRVLATSLAQDERPGCGCQSIPQRLTWHSFAVVREQPAGMRTTGRDANNRQGCESKCIETNPARGAGATTRHSCSGCTTRSSSGQSLATSGVVPRKDSSTGIANTYARPTWTSVPARAISSSAPACPTVAGSPSSTRAPTSSDTPLDVSLASTCRRSRRASSSPCQFSARSSRRRSTS